MVEVLHLILETICVLISRMFFEIPLKMFFSKFSCQKFNLLQSEYFAGLQMEMISLNIFSNEFQQIDSKTNEIYLLGDFNINLLQNGKFILKENQSYKLKSSSSALVNKYKEFCQTFSLTEIIKEPTRITCSTSTLLRHILTNFSEKASQKG